MRGESDSVTEEKSVFVKTMDPPLAAESNEEPEMMVAELSAEVTVISLRESVPEEATRMREQGEE